MFDDVTSSSWTSLSSEMIPTFPTCKSELNNQIDKRSRLSSLELSSTQHTTLCEDLKQWNGKYWIINWESGIAYMLHIK